MRLLCGKELRHAVEHSLPVRYVEAPYDPADSGFDEVCQLEPATVGYFIGPSDIEPDMYEDSDLVGGPTDTCDFGIYAVDGIDYGPRAN